MHRDYRLYVDDILEAIELIQGYVENYVFDDFTVDRKTQDAVIRNLEIIGEAAKHLPETIKESAPEIEWRKIISFRNILTHEYFVISIPMIGDIIQDKLVPLGKACRSIINEE
jgi:uncharacterized protein with HEPN domain